MKKQDKEHTKKNAALKNVKALSVINNKKLTTFFNSLPVPKELVSKLNDASHLAQSVLSNKNSRALLLMNLATMTMADEVPNPLYFDWNNMHYSLSTVPTGISSGNPYSRVVLDFFQSAGKKLLSGACGNITSSHLIPAALTTIWEDDDICNSRGFKFARALFNTANQIFENCVVNNTIAPQRADMVDACDQVNHEDKAMVGIILGSTFGSVFFILAVIGIIWQISRCKGNYQSIPSAPSNTSNSHNPKSKIEEFETELDFEEGDSTQGYQNPITKISKMLA